MTSNPNLNPRFTSVRISLCLEHIQCGHITLIPLPVYGGYISIPWLYVFFPRLYISWTFSRVR